MTSCSRHQILLVDDEASVRTLATLLASAGYDVATDEVGDYQVRECPFQVQQGLEAVMGQLSV
jgi:CheY-like chemotaxis protein